MKKHYKLQVLWWATRERGLTGAASTLSKILRSVLLGQRRLIFTLAISVQYLPPVCKIRGYEVELITSSDLINNTLKEQLIQHRSSIRSDAETMLKNGACLWVGYLDGHLANLAWTRTGDKVQSYFFPLVTECILISHCVTLPDYRGRGLYPAIMTHIIRTLGSKGFERFYVDCSDWNVASERPIRRLGFYLIGRGKYKKTGRLAWYQDAPQDFRRIQHA